MPKVRIAALRDFRIRALQQVGMSPEDAAILVDVLLEPELRGYHGGGPAHDRMATYVARIKRGEVNPRPAIRVIKETPVSLVLDGDRGAGPLVCVRAFEACIAKAKASGIGMAAIRNTHGIHAQAYFPTLAQREGLIGFITSNSPAALAPSGGTQPMLGYNPTGWGFPTKEEAPVALDMSFAQGPGPRLDAGVRALEQELFPYQHLDQNGRPSKTAVPGGSAVPSGGHKGYAWALVMAILATVLSEAPFQITTPISTPDWGHFALVLDPKLFLPEGRFEERMDAIVRELRSTPLAEGARQIALPGERSARTKAETLTTGVVEIPDSTWEAHQKLAEELPGLPKLEAVA